MVWTGAGAGGDALVCEVTSVWSGRTLIVRIRRGTSPLSVPLATPGPVGREAVETDAPDGGDGFCVNGGNTTRGPPERASTSTGCSSRDATRSPDMTPTRS